MKKQRGRFFQTGTGKAPGNLRWGKPENDLEVRVCMKICMDSIQDELYLHFSPLVANALSSKCWYNNDGLLNDVTLTIFWVINMTQTAKLQQNYKMRDMKRHIIIHICNAGINI